MIFWAVCQKYLKQLHNKKMKYVIITGVSTGIGYDTTRLLIEKGFHVFGSVRKQDDAQRLKTSFGTQFTPLLFDVTDNNAIDESVKLIKKIIGNDTLSGLINNAGIAVSGPIVYITREELNKQFDVNVFSVVNITRAFLPLLKGANPARIINISSVSGKTVFPFLGAYAASKYALEAISDAMRLELMIYGIDVIVIEPGSTESAIWEKTPNIEKYDATDYKASFRRTMDGLAEQLQNLIPVERVSGTIYKALTTKNPKTRYTVVKNKLINWWLPKVLSDRTIDKILAKITTLNRKV